MKKSIWTKEWIIKTAQKREKKYGGEYRDILLKMGYINKEEAEHIKDHVAHSWKPSKGYRFCPLCIHMDTYKEAHSAAWGMVRRNPSLLFGMVTFRLPREGRSSGSYIRIDGGLDRRLIPDYLLPLFADKIGELLGHNSPFIVYEQIGKESIKRDINKMIHSHFHAIAPLDGIKGEMKIRREWTTWLEEMGFRFTDEPVKRVVVRHVAKPHYWKGWKDRLRQTAVILTKNCYYAMKPIIMPFNILTANGNNVTVRIYKNREGVHEDILMSYEKLDAVLQIRNPRRIFTTWSLDE